jgi:hypothetical protein
MINTLIEVDNKIREFCNKSAIVNQYLSGDFSTFNSSDNSYPLIFMSPVKTRVQNGLVQFYCDMNFMDLCYERSNLVKVLSDLNILITELFIYLSDDADNDMYHLTLLTPQEFQSWYRGVDNTCGYAGQIIFNLTMNISTENIRWK